MSSFRFSISWSFLGNGIMVLLGSEEGLNCVERIMYRRLVLTLYGSFGFLIYVDINIIGIIT